MNTKHIIALVTFVVTFTASGVLVQLFRPTYQVQQKPFVTRGCIDSTAQRISQLIRQDVENGRVRAYNTFSGQSVEGQYSAVVELENYAEETEIYTKKLENLNAENLPSEFQFALQNHKQAWRNQADFLNDVKDIEGSRFSDIRYSPTFSQYDSEITRTWFEVLRIARENGAAIPVNAY